MSKHDVMVEARSIVLSHEGECFSDVLNSGSQVEVLIEGLIYALGYESVSRLHVNNEVNYQAKLGSVGGVVLVFNMKSKSFHGDLRGSIESTFDLVMAVETELDKALMYPKELRENIIEDVVSRVGVSVDRYKTILKNWKFT